MEKIGIIGTNHGAKIAHELSQKYLIGWQINSRDSYSKQEYVDWVYIATPIEFHAEQALYFIKEGSNVILEKTPVVSLQVLDELINSAKKNGVIIYFSDIYRFRDDIRKAIPNIRKIEWMKATGSQEWIVTRLAFHYLYLISEANVRVKIKSIKVGRDYLSMTITSDNGIVEMNFQQNAGVNFHKLNGIEVAEGVKGPISKMIENIYSSRASIENNHLITRRALIFLLEIKNEMPVVNIAGAGIFGCQTAIQLSKCGYNVVISEKYADIMRAASSINQYRVHRGYHYPRSDDTAYGCRKNSDEFCANFREAICSQHESYYSISTDQSLTSSNEYLDFLKRHSLEFEIVNPQKNCDLTIKANEPLFDPVKMKIIIKQRISSLGVKLVLGKIIDSAEINSDGSIWVSATYAGSGLIDNKDYQHEICEKPIVKLPKKFAKKSVVIMDGPFMCLDPYADTEFHVLGNVRHAIHSTNVGRLANLPIYYENFIDKGMVRPPKFSKFRFFMQTFEKYFENADCVEHVGSMFTVRTVLPRRDHDDARPTMVRKLSYNHIQIFSGKIVSAISASKEAEKLVSNLLQKK